MSFEYNSNSSSSNSSCSNDDDDDDNNNSSSSSSSKGLRMGSGLDVICTKNFKAPESFTEQK